MTQTRARARHKSVKSRRPNQAVWICDRPCAYANAILWCMSQKQGGGCGDKVHTRRGELIQRSRRHTLSHTHTQLAIMILYIRVCMSNAYAIIIINKDYMDNNINLIQFNTKNRNYNSSTSQQPLVLTY